jgi:hypothetical protein
MGGYLTSTELASGFINRFVILAVRRTQLLPDGGDLSAVDRPSLTDRFAAAVDHGRKTEEPTVTPTAREHWRKLYPRVPVDNPGLFGAATARAEARFVRLALLYALLDCAESSTGPTSTPLVPCGVSRVGPPGAWLLGRRRGPRRSLSWSSMATHRCACRAVFGRFRRTVVSRAARSADRVCRLRGPHTTRA